MRPAGEVRQALMMAARDLAAPDSAPTLRELADQAGVGYDVAEGTVKNMVRAGHLQVARLRRVDYRNRPVAEYEPAALTRCRVSGTLPCPLQRILYRP